MFLFVENLTFLDKGPSSFAVEKGECVGLTGRSGIGKTQLFQSLPGMMTGQIWGGTPPVEAVTYQILIMFLIAGGTGFGVVSAIWMSGWRLFDERHRLRLDVRDVDRRDIRA